MSEKRTHLPRGKSNGMSDWVECSCGWCSTSYWDGMEWALDEWKKHQTEAEETARVVLHETAGEHWWEHIPNGYYAGQQYPVVAPDGDPGAEGRRCRFCQKEEWFRGPGY